VSPEAACSLTPLLERISRLEAAGSPWTLSSADVRELLGVERSEYYRRIAAAEAAGNRLVGMGAATGRFAQENIGELVALLELFCGADSERRLQEAGVFFTYSEQAEILQVFHSLSAQTVRAHRLRREDFRAMLRTYGRWERATTVYLSEYLSVEALVQATVDSYCSRRSFGLPALARANVARLLGYFFQKHLLDAEVLLAPIRAALFAQAAREGYAEASEGRDSEQGAESPEQAAEAQAREACRIMGIEPAALVLPLLKGQYKRLMKRYHPDLNPEGLRRCQEINSAYALLISRLEKGL
jgi:hypothetical protein